MKLEVYVMAWWQTQQNIQSLSIPTKYEVRSPWLGDRHNKTNHWNMKLEVYVMAWWQTQQNIQSLSIPTKYEVGSLCDGLVTDRTKHPIIKYPTKYEVGSLCDGLGQTQQNIQSLSIPTNMKLEVYVWRHNKTSNHKGNMKLKSMWWLGDRHNKTSNH